MSHLTTGPIAAVHLQTSAKIADTLDFDCGCPGWLPVLTATQRMVHATQAPRLSGRKNAGKSRFWFL